MRQKNHKVARLLREDVELHPTASRRGLPANFIVVSLGDQHTKGDEIDILAGCGGHLRGVGDRDSQRKAQARSMAPSLQRGTMSGHHAYFFGGRSYINVDMSV